MKKIAGARKKGDTIWKGKYPDLLGPVQNLPKEVSDMNEKDLLYIYNYSHKSKLCKVDV